MHRLRPILNRTGFTLQRSLSTVRCFKHRTQQKFCRVINHEPAKSTERVVHDTAFNYIVEDDNICCEVLKSRKFSYLRPKLINDDASNYIKFNNERIYQIGQKYVTHGLLVYCSRLTINGNNKTFG